MALTTQDFKLSENQIHELNAFIQKTSTDFFASDENLHPIDIGSVTVSFDFGPPSGRGVTVEFAGKWLDLE